MWYPTLSAKCGKDGAHGARPEIRNQGSEGPGPTVAQGRLWGARRLWVHLEKCNRRSFDSGRRSDLRY